MRQYRQTNVLRLWWAGTARPSLAFQHLKSLPAPAWGFWIILIFNLLISLTTDLVRYLTGGDLLLPSWLTFLNEENYLFAELFFLPFVRLLHAIITVGLSHIALRLLKQNSDFDLLFNLGGLGYLVVMPVILVSDWIILAFGRYDLAAWTHPLTLPWSMSIGAFGMIRLLGVRPVIAWGVTILCSILSLPMLSIFAR